MKITPPKSTILLLSLLTITFAYPFGKSKPTFNNSSSVASADSAALQPAKAPVLKKEENVFVQEKKIEVSTPKASLVVTPSNKPKEEVRTAPSSHLVTITNKITSQAATYTKHWSGNYTPEWKLLVNGKELAPNQTAQVTLVNNKLELEFVFDFLVLGKSYQKGNALASFKIPPTLTQLNIDFSWDKPERLVLHNTTSGADSSAQPVLITYNEKK